MVHVTYRLKIVIGIMNVLYVNVVEQHLLAEVFLLKDLILFVLIVVNDNNIMKQKIIVTVVDIVMLLVIIREQIKEDLLVSIPMCTFSDEKKQN